VADYGELADKLSHRQIHARDEWRQSGARAIDAAEVYERVKLLVGNEIDKANVELRKRRLALIERVYMPCCQGRLCLTYSSDLLCTVDLEEAKGQITAVISGPPNASEISRREFAMDDGADPERITVEIVSGLLMGEFA
jgi:hypothetical protein